MSRAKAVSIVLAIALADLFFQASAASSQGLGVRGGSVGPVLIYCDSYCNEGEIDASLIAAGIPAEDIWMVARSGAFSFTPSTLQTCTSANGFVNCDRYAPSMVKRVDGVCRTTRDLYGDATEEPTCFEDLAPILPPTTIVIFAFGTNNVSLSFDNPEFWESQWFAESQAGWIELYEECRTYGLRCLNISGFPLVEAHLTTPTFHPDRDENARDEMAWRCGTGPGELMALYPEGACLDMHPTVNALLAQDPVAGAGLFFDCDELYADQADCDDGVHPGAGATAFGFTGRELQGNLYAQAIWQYDQRRRSVATLDFTQPVSSFVAWAASVYSAFTEPDFGVPAKTDTSSWTFYDATCECVDDSCVDDAAGDSCTPAAGTRAFPQSWGLSPAIRSDDLDDAATLYGLIANVSDDSCIWLREGVFDVNSNTDGGDYFWRMDPATDHRGFCGQSRAATLRFWSGVETGVGINVPSMKPLEGDNMVLGISRPWDSGVGGTKGDTAIPMSDTSGFSQTPGAAGNWVRLEADPNSVQGFDTNIIWLARITQVVTDSFIVIEQPLVADFDGGNATAQPWTPAEDIVFHDLTLEFKDNAHLNRFESGWLVNSRGTARMDFDNVHFKDTYQVAFYNEDAADLRIVGSAFTGDAWDKGPNGYCILLNASRAYLADNYMECVTGVAFAGYGQANVAVYNEIRGPLPNATFDVDCTEGGTGCLQPSLASHQAAHGPVLAGGYTHCSGNLGDQQGLTGSGCRGERSSACFTCAEMHNLPNFSSIFARNRCECGFWFDDNNGPGRDNWIFGNELLPEDITPPIGLAQGPPGTFNYINGPANGVEDPLTTYAANHVIANNVVGGNLGGAGVGIDAYGDGMRFLDNVVAGQCYTQEIDDTGGGADGGDCTQVTINPGTLGSTNTDWTNNTIGAAIATSVRNTPTLPGFDDFPTFTHAPTSDAPYLGPELLGAASCLSASIREAGGCQRIADGALFTAGSVWVNSNGAYIDDEHGFETTLTVAETDTATGGGQGWGHWGGINYTATNFVKGQTIVFEMDMMIPADITVEPVLDSLNYSGFIKLLRWATSASVGGANKGFIDLQEVRGTGAGSSTWPGDCWLLHKENDTNPSGTGHTYLGCPGGEEPLRGAWHNYRWVVVLDDVPRSSGGNASSELYVDGVSMGESSPDSVTLIDATDVVEGCYLMTIYNGIAPEDQRRLFRNPKCYAQ